MKSSKQWALIFGALLWGVGGFAVSAQGTAGQCTSEDCACEHALEQNTVEAIEEFLKKYPQSVNSGDTACAALAVPPLEDDLGSQNTDEDEVPASSGEVSVGG